MRVFFYHPGPGEPDSVQPEYDPQDQPTLADIPVNPQGLGQAPVARPFDRPAPQPVPQPAPQPAPQWNEDIQDEKTLADVTPAWEEEKTLADFTPVPEDPQEEKTLADFTPGPQAYQQPAPQPWQPAPAQQPVQQPVQPAAPQYYTPPVQPAPPVPPAQPAPPPPGYGVPYGAAPGPGYPPPPPPPVPGYGQPAYPGTPLSEPMVKENSGKTAEPKKGKGGKIALIAILVILLVGGIGAGVYFGLPYLKGENNAEKYVEAYEKYSADENLFVINKEEGFKYKLENLYNPLLDVSEAVEGVYVGSLKDNLPEGQGAFWFQLKSGESNADCILLGKWEKGQPVGTVKLREKFRESGQARVYEARYKDGKLTGGGSCRLSDGSIWTGEYEDGHPGYGKRVFTDGMSQEGQFDAKVEIVEGKTIYPDGPVFEGKYAQGEPAEGTMLLEDGSKLQGTFSAQGLFLEGRQEWADGDVYEGRWDGENFEGTIKFHNGDTYEGSLENGQFKKGKYTLAGGQVLEGEFKGTNLWTGKATAEDGTVTEFVDGKPKGS